MHPHKKGPVGCSAPPASKSWRSGNTGRSVLGIGPWRDGGNGPSNRRCAQRSIPALNSISLLAVQQQGERSMLRCLLWALAAAVQPKVLLIADNLCLRQQLLALQRRMPRPRLEDADRRFWILACRWFSGWRTPLLIVKPETVLRWHRRGWRTYWRRRSRRPGRPGRRPIAPELRTLIRRMTTENRLWVSGGSRRSWRGSDSRSDEPAPPRRRAA